MFSTVRVVGHGRVGSADQRAASRARHRRGRRGTGSRPVVRAGFGDSRRGSCDRAGPMGGACQRSDAACRARAACPPVRRPSAADVHPRARTRTTRRRLGGRDGRNRRGAHARPLACGAARACGRSSIREESRVLYHAGAAMASNYLVTLHRLASRLFERAGAPPEALLPLMRRTIDNGFELTGPIARGDWAIVDAHLAAIHEAAPDIEVDVPRAGSGNHADEGRFARPPTSGRRSNRRGERRRSGSCPRWARFTRVTSPCSARRSRSATSSWRQRVREPDASSTIRPISPPTRATAVDRRARRRGIGCRPALRSQRRRHVSGRARDVGRRRRTGART